MIRTFRTRETALLFEGVSVRRFQLVQRVTRRKLEQLDAAVELKELAELPGNRFKALRGDRAGQHSIRINDQWRIRFRWIDGEPYEVEIVDYH